MNVEDIKTLNDIQIVKEQSNKVLKQIAEEISQLKLAKEENLLSEREYNKEAQSREKIKKEQEDILEQVGQLEKAYSTVFVNLVALHNIGNLKHKNNKEKTTAKEETKVREKEILENMKKLTSPLQDAVRNDVLDMFKEKERLETETRKNSVLSESLIEDPYQSNINEQKRLISELKKYKERMEDSKDGLEKRDLKEKIIKAGEKLNLDSSLLANNFAEEQRQHLRGEELDFKKSLNKDGLSPEAVDELDRIDKEISELQDELKDLEKQAKDSKNRYKKIFNEETINQEQALPSDKETIDTTFEKYAREKEKEVEVFKGIEKQIKKNNNRIKKLKREQNEIRKFSLEAASLEISYVEYRRIERVLDRNNKRVLYDILDKKGIGDVIHKRGGKTKKELALIAEARNEIFTEIINYQKKALELQSIEKVISVLYNEDNVSKRYEIPRALELSKAQLEELIGNNDMIMNGDVNIQRNVEIPIHDDSIRDNVRSADPIPVVETPIQTVKQPAVISGPEEKIDYVKQPVPVEQPKPEQITPEQVVEEKIDYVKQDKPLVEKPIVEEQAVVQPIVETPMEAMPVEEQAPAKAESKVAGRSIEEIIKDIRKDLEVGKVAGKKYGKENLKVTGSFKNEMHSGNYLYNVVHIIPGKAKAQETLIENLSSLLLEGDSITSTLNGMRKNTDELSVEDINVLWDEYEKNNISQVQYPQAVVKIVQEKLQDYALGRKEAINEEIKVAYKQVFAGKLMIEAIDKKLKDNNLTKDQQIQLRNQKTDILEDIKDNINLIRNQKSQLDKLSIKGIKENKENEKHNIDKELEERLKAYEKDESRALAEENNKDFMDAFIHQELLLEETREDQPKNTISPLMEALEYTKNPFLRDVFQTIALGGSSNEFIDTIHVYQTVKENTNDKDDMNNRYLETMHKLGKQVVNSSYYYKIGMEAQANEDISKVTKKFENERFAEIQSEVKSIVEDVASNIIGEKEALHEIENIRFKQKEELQQVLIDCYKVLQEYKQVKPDFSVDAPELTEEFLRNHSNSISGIKQATTDTINMGAELLKISPAMVVQLPNELLNKLGIATASSILTYNLSNTMNNKYNYNLSQEDIESKIDEYIEKEAEQPQEEEEQLLKKAS